MFALDKRKKTDIQGSKEFFFSFFVILCITLSILCCLHFCFFAALCVKGMCTNHESITWLSCDKCSR